MCCWRSPKRRCNLLTASAYSLAVNTSPRTFFASSRRAEVKYLNLTSSDKYSWQWTEDSKLPQKRAHSSSLPVNVSSSNLGNLQVVEAVFSCSGCMVETGLVAENDSICSSNWHIKSRAVSPSSSSGSSSGKNPLYSSSAALNLAVSSVILRRRALAALSDRVATFCWVSSSVVRSRTRAVLLYLIFTFVAGDTAVFSTSS